jgi:hypothetical protein
VKILTTCGGEAVSDYLALGSRVVGAAVETSVRKHSRPCGPVFE